jgi:flagellin
MNEVHSMLQRMRELAVQANNGTLSIDDRNSVGAEAFALSSEIDRVATSTTFNGVALLDGTGGNITLQVGANATGDNQMTVSTVDVTVATLDTATTGGTGVDGAIVAFAVGTLGTDMGTTATLATDAIKQIDDAIGQVSTARGSLGAAQNRLEHTIASLGVASENLSSSESRIRDLDVAAEMVNFTKTQILQQAGTAILAQANQASQSVLTLLK